MSTFAPEPGAKPQSGFNETFGLMKLEFGCELFERQASLLNDAFDSVRFERLVLRNDNRAIVLPKNQM